MRRKFIALIAMSLFNPNAYCIVGEENLALFEIASNTAMQLNELEQLVSTSQKYTEQIMQMNDYANETLSFARRTEVWMEDMSYLVNKRDTKSLGEINSYIRDIKYRREELQDMITSVNIDKKDIELDKKKSEKVAADSAKRVKNYKKDGKATNLKDQSKVLGKIAGNTHNIMTEAAVTNSTLGNQLKATQEVNQTLMDQRLDELRKENEAKKNSSDFYSKGIKKRVK